MNFFHNPNMITIVEPNKITRLYIGYGRNLLAVRYRDEKSQPQTA